MSDIEAGHSAMDASHDVSTGEPADSSPTQSPSASWRALLGDRTRGATWTAAARWVLLWFPVALIAWFGWVRRFTCDDAFINYRIVRQLQGGNGPVFNAGDRVEAGTSPVWILVLAITDVLAPITLEWIAVILSITATAAGVAFAIAGTRHLIAAPPGSATRLNNPAVPTWLAPVGALVYVSIPAAWDFATSGLETGLGMFWIGLSWWALTRWAHQDNSRTSTGTSTNTGNNSDDSTGNNSGSNIRRAPRVLCLLLGIGPFVRPDFAVFSLCFALAVLWTLRRERRTLAHTIGWLAVIPITGTIIRMAYFGLPVPNTAIAKEASKPSWQRGWWYLLDIVQPYVLWLPLLVLVGVFVFPLLRRHDPAVPSRRLLVMCALAGAALHGLYIVRLGGDFMHARMLLPTLFVMLLPATVIPLPALPKNAPITRAFTVRATAALVITVWAIACTINLRTPYSTYTRPGQAARIIDAISSSTNIGDERTIFRRLSGRSHPVTIDDYAGSLWWRGAERTLDFLGRGGGGLIIDTESNGDFQVIPLNDDVLQRAPAVVYVGALGMYAYRMPNDVWVVDRFGLSNSLSAHIRLTNRGRPGHEKDLPVAWIVAAYGRNDAPPLARVNPLETDFARQALQCGEFPDLLDTQREPLSIGRMARNITGAISLWRFRMPKNPIEAAAELCS